MMRRQTYARPPVFRSWNVRRRLIDIALGLAGSIGLAALIVWPLVAYLDTL